MPQAATPERATRVGRNALVISIASVFVRLSGLFREVVFAAFFGAGAATDAYNAAFRVAQFFRELLAEGSLSSIYVPTFADTLENGGLKDAFRLANAFLGVLLLVLGLVTVATVAFAEGWVFIVASGFADDPDKFALTATLTRIMAPFLATVSLASVFMGMLNVRGRFFLPAIAPAALNVAIIAACFLVEPFEAWTGQPGILLVGIATVIGGVGQFAVQMPALLRDGFRLRPTLAGHPALKRILKFLVPAFIGIMTVQFNLLVEMQIASNFGDGPVSYLQYAFRFIQIPLGVVAGAVGTAALAGLSIAVASGRRQDLPRLMRETLNLNTFLVLPAAVGLFMLANPLVELMFERGAFTPEATAATAAVLRMYAIATWGICMHRVLVPAYYAIGHPYFAMGAALLSMVAKVPVALLLVYTLGMGIIGLPLSHGLLVTFEVAILWWGLGKRTGGLSPRIYVDHLRMLGAVLAMTATLWALRDWSHGLRVLPVAALCGVVYFAVAHLLGVEDSRRVLTRLLSRRPKGLPPSVDEETRQQLSRMVGGAAGAMTLVDDRLQVDVDGARFVVRASRGVLMVSLAGEGQGDGEPLEIMAVMRVGQGPPMLHGLVLGGRAFRAQGERVVEGDVAGPRIPVG